jgi:hypothetical protein
MWPKLARAPPTGISARCRRRSRSSRRIFGARETRRRTSGLDFSPEKQCDALGVARPAPAHSRRMGAQLKAEPGADRPPRVRRARVQGAPLTGLLGEKARNCRAKAFSISNERDASLYHLSLHEQQSNLAGEPWCTPIKTHLGPGLPTDYVLYDAGAAPAMRRGHDDRAA